MNISTLILILNMCHDMEEANMSDILLITSKLQVKTCGWKYPN